MSNMNSYAGFINLPALSVGTSTSEVGYTVPAAGVYPGLPSPAQPLVNGSATANELYISADPEQPASGLSTAQAKDVVTASVLDARCFYARVSGKVHAAASENVTVKIYAVPGAGVLLGGAMHSATNAGSVASTSTMASGGAGDFNFELESQIMWDVTGTKIGSIFQGITLAGAAVARTASTQLTAGYLSSNDLNFVVTVQFSSGNALNTISLAEFSLNRD